MRAVRLHGFGGVEVLGVDEVPEPVRGPGEVLIRAVASSINPVDDKTRQGVFPDTGKSLGWELAGVVVDGGDSPYQPGDRVFAMSHHLSTGRGTWADLVALPADIVASAPASISLLHAATLPLPALTAWQTLDWLQVGRGERVLVAGAAGAVGGLALQLAVARGARVDALVSRPAQLERVRGLGATLATTEPDELTPGGYDAVFDTFGAFVLDAVADGGRYTSIATQAGPVPELSARKVRTANQEVRADGAALAALSRLVDDGVLRPRIDSVFGIEDVRAAHERFQRGGLDGKVVLVF